MTDVVGGTARAGRGGISLLASLGLTLSLVGAANGQQAPQSTPGRNVNVNGGPTWIKTSPFEIIGDPWRNQTVEPECDVSSRNPAVIVCGGVDYRMVDLPGGYLSSSVPPSPHPDSWNMLAQSRDGGLTWMSRPHPGHLLDESGTAIALKKYAFTADPTVRFGAAGVMFHLGLAADRGDHALSAIYVSVWMHLNNLEYDPEPVKFTGRLVEVATGSPGQFVDRPHMAIGEPICRTCSIDVPVRDETGATTTVTQTVPCTPAYVAYATFVGDRQKGTRSKIYFTKSLNLGKGWARPILVSEQNTLNQGVQVVAIPGTHKVLLFWRRGAAMAAQTDAIMMAVSTDDGDSFGKAKVFASICPFDQDNDATHFRVRTMPNAAAGPGYALVTWADRGVTATGACEATTRPARVFAAATDGVGPSARVQVDPDSPHANHQIFPTVAIAAGRVHVAWMDFRADESLNPAFGVAFNPREIDEADNFPPFSPPDAERARHTADMWAAEKDLSASQFEPAFPVSQYIWGKPEGGSRRQLQWNVPIVRNFNKMTIPFNGDFNASRGELVVPIDPVQSPGRWGFNFGLTGPARTPVFHDFWTDGRNMVLLPNEDYTMPRPYTPPSLDQAEGSTVSGLTSLYDPSLSREVCDPTRSGTKNLDIYTARTTQGLYAFAPFNNKSLGYQTYEELGSQGQQLVQRAFPVVVENTAAGSGAPDEPLGNWYELSIANQPAGGLASFDQFEKTATPAGDRRTTWDVWIPWKSMIAQTVYVKSPAKRAAVRIDVVELDGPDPAVKPSQPKEGGLRTTVFLNPDPSAPRDLLQPGQVDQAFDVSKYEIHQVKIENVTAQNISLAVPGQGLTEEELESAWAEPGWKNPGWKNPGWKNPGWKNDPWQYPGWKNTNWESPGWKNSAWESPGWKNEALGDTVTGGSARYITAQVVNDGCRSGDPTCANTYTAYNANVLVNGVLPFEYQLIVYKLNPAPAMTVCEPALVRHTQVLVNIPRYNPSAANFSVPDPRATFVLAPDEVAYVVLVAYSDEPQFPAGALPTTGVGFTVTPQPFDTPDFLYFDVTCPGCPPPPSPPPSPSPSLFIVTTTADSGPGSLRNAIDAANQQPGPDLITFAIPGAGPHRIALVSPLPPVSDPVVIDGTTQPGYTASPDLTPAIELAGGGAGAAATGLSILAGNSVVRGLVINGFAGAAIALAGTAGGNLVEGNFIGTDVNGSSAVPNGTGVQVSSPNSVIGGAGPARNVISGNAGIGVHITGSAAVGNQVRGSYIGTGKGGDAALPNQFGVYIDAAASGNVVGGAGPAGGNVISGNSVHGLWIFGDATANLVKGNRIGVGADGASPVPNGVDGLVIGCYGPGCSAPNSPDGNAVGGTQPGEANVISENGGAGVSVRAGVGNRISGNAIFGNGNLGIDLVPQGVTPDDLLDVDTGPNQLQNYPVVGSAVHGGPTQTTVGGTLSSAPGSQFQIEFFASPSCDGSQYGEGARFIGATTVATDGAGEAAFAGVLVGSTAVGEFVTATATDQGGSTSEFSACTVVTAVAPLLPDLTVTLAHYPPNPTDLDIVTATATVTNVGSGPAPASWLELCVGGETPGPNGDCNHAQLGPLAPQASATVTREDTLPVQDHVNHALADYLQQVPESDEGNNGPSDSYTVVAASGFPVSGTVFYSSAGLGDVKVELGLAPPPVGWSTPPLRRTTTDGAGLYSFASVAGGSGYWLKVYGPTSEYIGWVAPTDLSVGGPGLVQDVDLPKIITLQEPLNHATGVGTTPTLSWTANPEAVRYTVQINRTADWFPITPSPAEVGNVTTFIVPSAWGLESGTDYTWQVGAYDGAGHNVGTTFISFRFVS
jgi:hypothetical protein